MKELLIFLSGFASYWIILTISSYRRANKLNQINHIDHQKRLVRGQLKNKAV
jgi:hypothetical protein